MKIGTDAIIPEDKLTRYLLTARPRDDKSKFLAQAGFLADNPEDLRAAIEALAAAADAREEDENEYGVVLRANGELLGPNGRSLAVTTIWLRWRIDGSVHFITLKPRRESAP
jgi:hypothetical protein